MKLISIVAIGLVIIVSGCTGGKDVTSVVKALPEVQQFMSEHPNAKITITYWSEEEVSKSINEINQQCGKPITPVAMYKAMVSEGDLKIVSWINAENKIVMCTTVLGGGLPTVTETVKPTVVPTTPAPTPIPTPARVQAVYRFYVHDIDGFYRVRALNTTQIPVYTNFTLRINAGDKVIWESESENYTITIVSEQGLWDNTSAKLRWDTQTFSYTFTQPGTYGIYVREFPKIRHQKIVVNP